MTDKQDTELNALITLLDTVGADRARWPTGAETRFAELIATNPHARQAVAEAQALERALNLAPRVSGSREAALMAQIMVQTRSARGVLNEASSTTTTPWPPSEAAIQGPQTPMIPIVVLDGRVEPGHGVTESMRYGPIDRPPVSNVVPMRAPAKPAPVRHLTQGFGLMAAALLLGIIVGAGGLASPVFDSMAEAVGLTEDTSELAYATDVLPGGEDTL
jgi:hypothetical protein